MIKCLYTFKDTQVAGKIGKYTIKEDYSNISSLKIYDSFDNKLLNKDIIFSLDGNRHHISLKDSACIDSSYAESLLNIRKPLILFESNVKLTKYSVFNKDKKIVFLLFCAEIEKIFDKKLIIIKSKKGYDKETEKVSNALSKREFFFIDFKFIKSTLKKQGVSMDYKSEIVHNFKPNDNIFDALQQIFKFELEIAKADIKGIINDTDPEFLHDYRISLRKTRAIFKEFKSVFDKNTYKQYSQTVNKLFKPTNTLRDLDVFLIFLEKYEKKVELDISEIKSIVLTKREQEFRAVKQFFIQDKFDSILKEWSIFIRQGIETIKAVHKSSSMSLNDMVEKIVKRKSRMLNKFSSYDFNDVSDEKIHRLRIHCKRLRYILEYFQSIMDSRQHEKITSALKKFQNFLGKNQDLSFQIAMTNNIKNQMKQEDIGREFIFTIQKQKEKNLKQFKKKFLKFLNESSGIRVEELMRK